jgi:ATP-dependent exoDNAse (exonuclease V) alpha subunit
VEQVVEKIVPSNVRGKVLHAELWPTANQFQFDSSQYEALQNAATCELSVIQGPPGTGKTFIGLKLVQLLLHNKRVWQGSQPQPAADVKQQQIKANERHNTVT